jgi:hypothetical protein
MFRFLSGKDGIYNLSTIEHVYQRRVGSVYTYYATLANGNSVEIYKSAYEQVEGLCNLTAVVQGTGICRWFWGNDCQWTETSIIGWCLYGNGCHEPICIEQPVGSYLVVIKDGECWIDPADASFSTWDAVIEEARKRIKEDND